ncbi:MAG: muramoyltetrapeptide carboxypeptidase [Janthinobacterium lividum]
MVERPDLTREPNPSIALTVRPAQDLAGLGIAIIAPSGQARDINAVTRALDGLRARGANVNDYSGYSDSRVAFQRFAADDGARLAQIHAAANDADVQIVLALRGGYGLTRLLPAIDFPLLAESGKLFVGHSDFTALQLGLLARAGRQSAAGSFAGPMICSDFSREVMSDFTMNHFWHCVNGPEQVIAVSAPGNPLVEVEGTLWGGNLAMVNSLIGTPWMPLMNGGILFIEDVGEHPYRIERMLLQLAQCGILARQSAVLLGEFTSYRLGEIENGYDFAAMLAYLRSVLPIPVLTGLPFGHVADKVTLPQGAHARLTSHPQGWDMTMTDYRCLSR